MGTPSSSSTSQSDVVSEMLREIVQSRRDHETNNAKNCIDFIESANSENCMKNNIRHHHVSKARIFLCYLEDKTNNEVGEREASLSQQANAWIKQINALPNVQCLQLHILLLTRSDSKKENLNPQVVIVEEHRQEKLVTFVDAIQHIWTSVCLVKKVELFLHHHHHHQTAILAEKQDVTVAKTFKATIQESATHEHIITAPPTSTTAAAATTTTTTTSSSSSIQKIKITYMQPSNSSTKWNETSTKTSIVWNMMQRLCIAINRTRTIICPQTVILEYKNHQCWFPGISCILPYHCLKGLLSSDSLECHNNEEIASSSSRGMVVTVPSSKQLNLHLKGWELDKNCLQLLCQATTSDMSTTSNNDRLTPACSSNMRSISLVGLTFKDCLWDHKTLRLKSRLLGMNHQDDEDTNASNNIVIALSQNNTLESLHLDVSSIPHEFFSWKDLSAAVKNHPTLKSFWIKSTRLSKEQMKYLLEAYQHAFVSCKATLQGISIPIPLGDWTSELQLLLRKVLFLDCEHLLNDDLTVSKHSSLLRQVCIKCRPLPATDVPLSSPSSVDNDIIQHSNPALLRRRQVWSIWKDFLVSSETASRCLQELDISDLTSVELLELSCVLQQRKFHANLTSLRLEGTIALSTLIALVESLGSHPATRTLTTHLHFTLRNGDELYASEKLQRLANALKNHYGIVTLEVKCHEHSTVPHVDFLCSTCYTNRNDPITMIQSIIALNRAGRQYLLQSPSCKLEATKVLTNVAKLNIMDAIYHHMLENPSIVAEQ